MGGGSSAVACKNYIDKPEGDLSDTRKNVCKDMCPDFPDKEKCTPTYDEIINFYNEEPPAKACKYALCDHWTWDGDGSCWWGLTGNYTNTCSNSSADGTPVLGGHGCNSSSYRISGCEDHEILGYYKTNYRGDPRVFRSPKGDLWENNLRSVKVTEIPRRIWKRILVNTDGECPGATKTYKRVAGKKNACFYDDGNDTAVRSLLAGGSATDHAAVKEKFCKLSKNVFKNPGGGPCLEYDTAKSLAKEYCSVGDRIAKDASCTPTNLGNFYAGIAETYCKTAAGKADVWCSCYNVTNNVCDTDSAAAGCDKKRQQFDKLVEATPEGFRNVWSGKAACFGGVCQGAKYVPQNANQNCNAPVQICAQSFDLSQISESTIEAQCNLTATTTTAPSAGDGPSGTPSGTPTPSPSGTPTPSPPENGIDINNNTTRLAIGGGALFMLCCCLLIIIVLMSSSGGGGRGPSRFRR
ncbi:hypothetical protein APZ24_gp051 [Ostreococcus lucimarinus virus 2]|uniref:hypothetical protein n=1 Tax=Ostreococcus lucimarinus virus 2 TaxID=1663208 RepID=UPI0006D0EC03|nr:hypothetical protein APZ24_gp051 [Ostreococcus lucimarinus virus 2]ALI95414.1 hypothetical protein OlV2_051c [Ostreococcus lucimarinus virus 2]